LVRIERNRKFEYSSSFFPMLCICGLLSICFIVIQMGCATQTEFITKDKAREMLSSRAETFFKNWLDNNGDELYTLLPPEKKTKITQVRFNEVYRSFITPGIKDYQVESIIISDDGKLGYVRTFITKLHMMQSYPLEMPTYYHEEWLFIDNEWYINLIIPGIDVPLEIEHEHISGMPF